MPDPLKFNAIHKVTETSKHVRHGDDLVCTCGDYLSIIQTAYGFRASCRGCRIRWTTIITVPFGYHPIWEAENFSPMEDNCHDRP